MSKILSLFILLVLVNLIKSQISPELVSLALNDRININGNPYFRLTPYAESTILNTKYDYIPDLETNPYFTTYTYQHDYTILSQNWNETPNGTFDKPLDSTFYDPVRPELYPTFPNSHTVMVVPHGVTITANSATGHIVFHALVVYGNVVVLPGTAFRFVKLHLMPGSSFSIRDNSAPAINFRTGLYFTWYGLEFQNNVSLPWDPINTAQLICAGCTFNVDGKPNGSGVPVWYGARSAQNQQAIYKTGTFITGTDNFVNASYSKVYFTQEIYTSQKSAFIRETPVSYDSFTQQFTYGVNNTGFKNFGQVLARRGAWTTRVTFDTFDHSVNGFFQYFAFFGNASISISGANFYLPSLKPDYNRLDRVVVSNYFPITLVSGNDYTTVPGGNATNLSRSPFQINHVSKPFLIENMYFDQDSFGNSGFHRFDITTNFRSLLGIVRSFGKIKNCLFSTLGFGGFINIPWGTEVVEITGTAFRRTDAIDASHLTTAVESPFPWNNDFLTAVYTASPFVKISNCVFEGVYPAGSIVFRPIQNRSEVTGIVIEPLIGQYAGYNQNNSDNIRTNAAWNTGDSLKLSNNYFFMNAPFFAYGNNEPTLRYTVKNSEFLDPKLGSERIRWELLNPVKNIEETFDGVEFVNLNEYTWTRNWITNFTVITKKTKAWNYYNSKQIMGGPLTEETFQTEFVDINNVESKSAIKYEKNYFLGFGNQLSATNVNHGFGDGSLVWGSLFHKFNATSWNLTADNLLFNFTFQNWILYMNEANESCTAYVDDQSYASIPYILTYTNPFPNNVTGPIVNHQIAVTPIEGPRQFKFNCIPTTPHTYKWITNGPLYYSTINVDLGASNFYLGVDYTPYIDPPKIALTNFGKNWTKCSWIPDVCQSSGTLVKVANEPSQIIESSGGATVNGATEKSMLTSYLTQANQTKSVFTNFTLPAGNYRFYLYFYNPSSNGLFLPLENRYIIKLNGKIQSPYTRVGPTTQQYSKVGPFYFNAPSNNYVAQFEVGGAGFVIQLSGIEILSDKLVPYPIPIDVPVTTGTTLTTTSTTGTTTNPTGTTGTTGTTTSATATTGTNPTSTTGSTTKGSTTKGSTTKGSTTKGSTTKGSTTKGSTTIKPIFAVTTRHHNGSFNLISHINHTLIMISLLLVIYFTF